MRRLSVVLPVLAVLATACGSTSNVEIVEAASPTTTAAPVVEDDTASDESSTVDPAADAAVDNETTDEVEPEQVALRTGREAILANHTEGKPYVLWYWGAH